MIRLHNNVSMGRGWLDDVQHTLDQCRLEAPHKTYEGRGRSGAPPVRLHRASRFGHQTQGQVYHSWPATAFARSFLSDDFPCSLRPVLVLYKMYAATELPRQCLRLALVGKSRKQCVDRSQSFFLSELVLHLSGGAAK